MRKSSYAPLRAGKRGFGEERRPVAVKTQPGHDREPPMEQPVVFPSPWDRPLSGLAMVKLVRDPRIGAVPLGFRWSFGE